MMAFAGIFQEQGFVLRCASHGKELQRLLGKWEITLPRTTSSDRDVSAITHEIGPVVLRHCLEDARWMVRAGGHGTELALRDRQASIFEAELLMPREAFCRGCRTCGNDVTRVAFHFGVSPAAAGVRMAILGLE